MAKPCSPAWRPSQSNAGVPSNDSSAGGSPGVPMSSARPEWCSEYPGAALTVRMSSTSCPRALAFEDAELVVVAAVAGNGFEHDAVAQRGVAQVAPGAHGIDMQP